MRRRRPRSEPERVASAAGRFRCGHVREGDNKRRDDGRGSGWLRRMFERLQPGLAMGEAQVRRAGIESIHLIAIRHSFG